MLEGKTVFLTGGAGFIGYNISRAYLYNGVKHLIIYDNFSSGREEFISDLINEFPEAEVSVIVADILDYPVLESYMVKFAPDIVNHHAAQLEITRCIDDPAYDIQSNLLGTLNVLEAMRACGCKTLINASSACVYGQNELDRAVTEMDKANPHWVYGMSKLSAEQLITIYCHDYNMKAVSFRYSIVMGVGEWYGRVGTLFIKRALNNEPLVIFGDGLQMRDIIDVDYAALANVNAVDFLDKAMDGFHFIFNISSGRCYSVKYLAETIKKVLNSESEIVYEDVEEGSVSSLVDNRVRIPQELRVMWLDNSRAKKTLKVDTSEFDLESLIKKEAAWISKHSYYWQDYHV